MNPANADQFKPPKGTPLEGAENNRELLKTSYLVCSTPRSGSEFLCTALHALEDLGAPFEYFHQDNRAEETALYGCSDLDSYIEFQLSYRTSKAGFFGAKLHWDQLRHMALEAISDSTSTFSGNNLSPDLLETRIPNLSYIYLTRRDIYAQAVSYWIAYKSDTWRSTEESGASGERPPIEYSRAGIKECLSVITESDSKWCRFFEYNGIQPLRLTYEELVANFENTILEIADYLGLPLVAADIKPPATRKQATGLNADFIERFLHEERQDFLGRQLQKIAAGSDQISLQEAEIALLRNEIATYKNSRSWKSTRPLRKIAGRFRNRP